MLLGFVRVLRTWNYKFPTLAPSALVYGSNTFLALGAHNVPIFEPVYLKYKIHTLFKPCFQIRSDISHKNDQKFLHSRLLHSRVSFVLSFCAKAPQQPPLHKHVRLTCFENPHAIQTKFLIIPRLLTQKKSEFSSLARLVLASAFCHVHPTYR